jgi:hypothetical protein
MDDFKSFGFANDALMMPWLLDVLPSSLKQKRIMAKLEETIRSNIEANLGRIRYDYMQRLEAGKEEVWPGICRLPLQFENRRGHGCQPRFQLRKAVVRRIQTSLSQPLKAMLPCSPQHIAKSAC